MIMEINFNEIKPYLRFVRYLGLNSSSCYAPSIPYDARLFYTFDGEGKIQADGKTYRMRKNSLIFINSGIEYHIEAPAESVLYLVVNFDLIFSHFDHKAPILPAIVNEYDNKNLIEHVVFSDVEEFNRVFYIESIPYIAKKLVSMEKEYIRKINMYELKLSVSMADILIQCFRYFKNNDMILGDNELAVRIIKYISMNFEKKLTNVDIAEYFNYHPNYISSLIKQYTGYPLNQYINQMRITKATELLSFTENSISEVAILCGYYDTSHFVRNFKKIIGITPNKYRNNY